jgi:hypothetical protein
MNGENDDNECIICFEKCNSVEYNCTNCNHIFHKKCYKNWIKRCKIKGINYKKCVYCQKEGYLYKNKNYCCLQVRVKI